MSVFVEVLEWAVHSPAEMVRRLPEDGSTDIKMGAQLVVQENQVAVFVRDGKYLDQLGPGRHVLSTLNLPVLTRALALPYGFQSPFRAAVIFVNRKVFTDLKWGTKNPVVFRDRDLGVVRLRGYGRFSLRVADPLIFLNTMTGSRDAYAVTELEDYLRDVIVSRLNDMIGEKVESLYDLPALYNELAAAAKIRLREDFSRFGLELVEFYVNSITPPETVQRMIDERSSLAAVGDLQDFLRFQAARAIGGHGAAGSGTAGHAAEAGIGAGIGLGLVPALLQGALAPAAAARPSQANSPGGAGTAPCAGVASAPPVPDAAPEGAATDGGATTAACSACHAPLPANARFCPECGVKVANASGADRPATDA